MTAFPLDANTVRAYLDLGVDGTSKYTDTTIGSNIRASIAILERRTHRYLEDRTATLKFTTNGNPYIGIPGLRTATSVTLTGATLTADAGYWLQPDAQQSGLATGIQLRGFGQRRDGPWWLSSPEWFDRNLDRQRISMSSLPNDLVIAGAWGYLDPPDDCRMAVKVLAAHLTKLADANSAGTLATPDGNFFDLSNYPNLVVDFIREWSVSPGVGGG